MRFRRSPLAVLLLGTLAPAMASSAVGTVERTIPMSPNSLSVELIPGPGGGTVTVQHIDPFLGGNGFRTTARRPDGRMLWSLGELSGCGNCYDGGGPLALQADGTIGPVGFQGSNAWAYRPDGSPAPVCSGALHRDGTCIAGQAELATPPPPPFVIPEYRPAVSAVRDGRILWRTVLRDQQFAQDFSEPPRVVRDRSGVVYSELQGPPAVPPVPFGNRGRIVALGAADGQVRWYADGPRRLLAALPSGALAVGERRLSALNNAGGVRWTRATQANEDRTEVVAVDSARGRVLVAGLTATPRAHWLAAANGRVLWASPVRERARPLAVDRRGRTYLARDAGPRKGLAVLGPRGAELWRLPTGRPVLDAVPQPDGRVAIILGGPSQRVRPALVIVRPPR